MLTYKTQRMNSFLPQGHWYALCTRTRCEKKVALTLSKKRIEIYLPLRTTAAHWGFLKKTEQEPLFPGIVFVNVTEEQLGSVLQTSGVCGVLHWLNAPALISENDIAQTRNFLADHTHVRVARSAIKREAVCEEVVTDHKVTRMQNTVSTSLSSLGYVLIADVPVQKEIADTPVPQLFPYYRYTDAG
jgi:transcription antitermination factor NusG